ncbi:MAG TPA: glycosyltransferase family 4 protein [Acidimicrobiales bacterium]|jgi:phosphatidylinositol alpha-mannosyltransferase|nr:glycosyltransferase family 4 protein [Acidimicrobiales bacterium]
MAEPVSRPLRVAMVCPYSLTVPGGVQSQVLGLARALRQAGHPTRILAPCDGPPPDSGVTPLGNSIPTAANGSVAPLAPDLPAQLRFIRALRDEDFDILHLHEPLVPGPTLTAAVIKYTPLIGTFHAAGASAAYRYLRPAVRRLAKRIDIKVAVSEDARALAQDALGGEFRLLYNGIEIERFAKADLIPTEGPTILFLGRHEPRKGLSVLLDAVGRLGADVRVWIAGDGPETESLKVHHAGDPRLEWLGRVSDAEKASRLRSADVYCAPSLHGESFGVVLLEAMAASTAIVASDLPGYRNVARPDRDALLVPPGDPALLAGALQRALDDATLRRDLVASGERRADDFSMHRLAARYVELYRTL